MWGQHKTGKCRTVEGQTKEVSNYKVLRDREQDGVNNANCDSDREVGQKGQDGGSETLAKKET